MVELPPDPNTVYDVDGGKLGTVPLTPKQLGMLQAGSVVSVFFHTPQLMHSTLGASRGAFRLFIQSNKTTTDTVDEFNQYLELQSAIGAAKGA